MESRLLSKVNMNKQMKKTKQLDKSQLNNKNKMHDLKFIMKINVTVIKLQNLL